MPPLSLRLRPQREGRSADSAIALCIEAASQITNFWSMKTAYEFLDLGSELTDDHLVYSSEMKFFDSSRVRPDPLCPTMTSLYDYDIAKWYQVYAFRFVRSFERGPLEVRSNDWVIATEADTSVVGQVGEMVEFTASGYSFVRMQLKWVRIALAQLLSGPTISPTLRSQPVSVARHAHAISCAATLC